MEGKRSHLAPFLEGPRPWLVLARNLIPVSGFYGFDWTSYQVFMQLWFDGAASLGAMLAFQVAVFAARDEKLLDGLPGNPTPAARPAVAALLWLTFYLLLGFPYWFALLVFGSVVGGPAALLACAAGVWAALLLTLAANISEEWLRGYGRMSNTGIRLEFDWHFHMHLARICVMITAAVFLRAGVIIPLVLALSYVEIYPMRALRFFGGTASLDRANERRSRD